MELNLINLVSGLMHVQYGVKRENSLIDFNEVEALLKHKPKLIIAGVSIRRVIDFKRFRRYCR